MYKFGILCFMLAASLVVNDAAQITEAQKSTIYGKLLTSGIECMGDFPLNLNHILSLRDKKVPDDKVAKCFIHCLFKSLGVMDNTGKIAEENTKKEVRKVFKESDEMPAKVDALLSKCIHVNEEETSDGEKGCDRAKLAFECFVEHSAGVGLDVVEFKI